MRPQLVRHALARCVFFLSFQWEIARDFVSTLACWTLELDWRGKGLELCFLYESR